MIFRKKKYAEEKNMPSGSAAPDPIDDSLLEDLSFLEGNFEHREVKSTLNLSWVHHKKIPSNADADEDEDEDDCVEDGLPISKKIKFSPKNAVFTTLMSMSRNVKTIENFLEPIVPEFDGFAKKKYQERKELQTCIEKMSKFVEISAENLNSKTEYISNRTKNMFKVSLLKQFKKIDENLVTECYMRCSEILSEFST